MRRLEPRGGYKTILHDPEFLLPWELWYLSIVRSCGIVASTVVVTKEAPRPLNLQAGFSWGHAGGNVPAEPKASGFLEVRGN